MAVFVYSFFSIACFRCLELLRVGGILIVMEVLHWRALEMLNEEARNAFAGYSSPHLHMLTNWPPAGLSGEPPFLSFTGTWAVSSSGAQLLNGGIKSSFTALKVVVGVVVAVNGEAGVVFRATARTTFTCRKGRAPVDWQQILVIMTSQCVSSAMRDIFFLQ